MPNTEVGSAYLSIYSQIDKNFTKGISGAMDAALKGVKAAGVAIGAAVGGAATAIGAISKASIDAYGEFEQLQGGAELMFGEGYDYIAERAKTAFADVQLSQNEYLQQVNGFAVGLKSSLDGNGQAAALLADRIVKAEADVVAATGNTQESVQNAFNGIMKSNFTMVDNLGLGITPTKEGFQEMIDSVNAWNAEQGKATSYTIDNLADCQSALVDYVEMQGMAGYATNEAAGTIQGSVAMMRASWSDFLTGLADPDADMGTLTENLVGSATTVVQNIAPRLGQITSTLIAELPGIIAPIAEQIPVVAEPILRTAIDTLGAAVTSALSGLGIQLPEGLLSFDSLKGAVEGFVSWVGEVWSGFGTTFESDEFDSALGHIQSVVGQVWGFIQENVIARAPEIGAVLGTVASVIGTVIDAVASVMDVVGPLVPMIAGALAAVKGFTIIQTVVGAVTTFVTTAGAALSMIGSVPGLVAVVTTALGGPITIIAAIVGAIVTLIATNEDARNAVVNAFNTIKETIGNAMGAAKDTLVTAWETIKVTVSQAMTNVKTTISGAWSLIRQTVQTAIDGVKGTIDGLSGIPDKVKGVFDRVRSAISEPINKAKDAVQGAIDRISGIINGAHLELPHFKLPHFRISGGTLPWGIGGKGTAPSIAVDWYARGGIIPPNSPRLIGVGDSREYEVIQPESRLRSMIAAGIRDGGGGSVTVNLNYDAGADAQQMAHDIARSLQRVQLARGY